MDIKIYPLKDGFYQLKYFDMATGRLRKKRFHTKKEALLYKATISNNNKRYGHAMPTDMRLSQALESFIRLYPNSRIRERKVYFKRFCEHFGAYKIHDLNYLDLENWFRDCKKKYDPSWLTLDRFKVTLFKFFEFLAEEGLTHGNLIRKVKIPKKDTPRRKRVVLETGEVKKILEDARVFDPKFLYVYLLTLAHTGARRKEILNLTRENIDFETGLIEIRFTKTRKDRFVRMSPTVIQTLKEHLNSHNEQRVFPNEDRSTLARKLDKFRLHFPTKKAWTIHSFRHSFAFNALVNNTLTMSQLQAILGHQNITTTVDQYGQLEAQDVNLKNPYEV